MARHGLRVLLLEKTTFPREKVCGDGLTPRATRQLIRMGVDTSEKAGWLQNKGLRVIGGGVRLELDWPELASQGPPGDRRRRPPRARLARAGQLPRLRAGPHPARLRRHARSA